MDYITEKLVRRYHLKIVRRILIGALILIGIVVLFSLFLFFDEWGEYFFGEEPDSAGQLLRLCLTGFVALGGIGVFWGTMRRANAADKTAKAQLEQNQINRFNQAIEQLGHNKASVRIGGIYTLHNIARDSLSHSERENICNILCSYVRDRSKFDLDIGEMERSYEKEINQPLESVRSADVDIQAVFDLLFKNHDYRIYKDFSKDLHGICADGLNLSQAKMDNAFMAGCSFIETGFVNVSLYKCIFFKSHFLRSPIIFSDSQQVDFKGSIFKDLKIDFELSSTISFFGITTHNCEFKFKSSKDLLFDHSKFRTETKFFFGDSLEDVRFRNVIGSKPIIGSLQKNQIDVLLFDFYLANFTKAIFSNLHFKSSQFNVAQLMEATFQNCTFNEACDFRPANLADAIFNDCDFSEVQKLEPIVLSHAKHFIEVKFPEGVKEEIEKFQKDRFE